MPARHTFGMLFWIRSGIALCILGLAVLPAFAHSWYDPSCCSGQDCAPIPSIAVTAGEGGWRVRLRVGDHPLVTGPIDVTVPYDEALPSQDGAFHACIRDQTPGWEYVTPIICLYVPDTGAGM